MQLAAFQRKYILELQRPKTLERVSTIEAALLLLVLKDDIHTTNTVCDILTAKLRSNGWEWIKDNELSIAALAIFAVYSYQPAAVDGTCLAHLANKMLASEAHVGGPYYNSDRKLDVFTNLTVSRLFKALGSPLANVDLFLKNRRPQGTLSGNVLIARNILYQWPRLHFSKHEVAAITKVLPFFGRALGSSVASRRRTADLLHQTISRQIYESLQSMDEPLRPHAISVWEMVNQVDERHEISMISAYFANSLEDRPKYLGKKLYVNLGMANFFVWMAYTIYDDFIDQEGRVELLPVANSMVRRALKIYEKMYPRDSFLQKEIPETFNKMDMANSWELAHCRFDVTPSEIHIVDLPAYSDFHILADRAWGHVLGPIIITSKLQAGAMKLADVKKGLASFLIAKQLSDDVRDWVDDFKKGQISPVVCHILKGLKVTTGLYNISEITSKMQEYFWSRGLKEINDIIAKQLAKSRRYFKKSLLLDLGGEFFLHILNPLEESVRESELQALHQKQFLTTYSLRSIKE